MKQGPIMRASLVLLALASAPGVTSRAAAQGDEQHSKVATSAAEELLAELGEPPRLEAAERLARRALEMDGATAREVADGLAASGGHAAAQALLELARHRDPTVRFAALQGIADVAL